MPDEQENQQETAAPPHEGGRDDMVDAVAKKLLKEVPGGDRALKTPEQVKAVLAFLKTVDAPKPDNDLLATETHFVNLPRSIATALQTGEKEKVVQAMKDFELDPAGSGGVGTFEPLQKSIPIDTVRSAIQNVFYGQGTRTIRQEFGTIARQIEGDQAVTTDKIREMLQTYKKDNKDALRKNDAFRRQVMGKLIEGLYPGLMEMEETKFFREILNPDNGESLEKTKELLEQFKTMTGDALFVQRESMTEKTKNPSELIARLERGEIGAKAVSRVLEGELKERISKKAVELR